MTVVASGIALACSPVSAAMAAMITLTDVAPYNFSMIEVLSVTIPAAPIGMVVTSMIINRVGKELVDTFIARSEVEIVDTVGGWVTEFGAVFFFGVFLVAALTTNGSQIAAANFDETGKTKLGTKLLDHSFILPVLLLGATVAISGVIIGILY